MNDTIKGTRAAADYCKMGHGAFLYHVRKSHVNGDFRAGGGALVFYTKTLDDFLQGHGNSRDLTIREIATKTGKSVGSVKGYIRRYNVPASAKLGRARTFSATSVRLIESLIARGEKIGVDDGDSL